MLLLLCQDQPDSIVKWMRSGRWTKKIDFGEGSANDSGFPAMPTWFKDNRHFSNIEKGLKATGLSEKEVAGVMGENWLRFFDQSFGPNMFAAYSNTFKNIANIFKILRKPYDYNLFFMLQLTC